MHPAVMHPAVLHGSQGAYSYVCVMHLLREALDRDTQTDRVHANDENFCHFLNTPVHAKQCIRRERCCYEYRIFKFQ